MISGRNREEDKEKAKQQEVVQNWCKIGSQIKVRDEWMNKWLKKVLGECLFLLKPTKWRSVTSTDHNNDKSPHLYTYSNLFHNPCWQNHLFSSHMSKRIIPFSVRIFRQLSPKWLWHPITEHQRQIKELMQQTIARALWFAVFMVKVGFTEWHISS